MNFITIFFIVLFIILLYITLQYFLASTTTLISGISAGTKEQKISASTLSSNSSNTNATNFSYSIWFYIDDWNYRFNDNKILLGRMGNTTATPFLPPIGGTDPCPLIVFGPVENNLSIYQSVYSSATPTPSEPKGSTNNLRIHQCNVNNIPIQVWTNLTISVYGRTMDIYLNGKLVNTCVMPGTAYVNSNADIYVTPSGGFSGWTSKLKYYPNSIDPQTAWNIYTSGYGGSFFSSYNVKFAFTENGKEVNSFSF